jgi:hypothetical protein
MNSWRFLFLAVSSLLLATSVQAGGKDMQRERAARKACLAGDYAKGVSILSDLFLDTKNSTHIYNQARCLEQNGRFEDSVFHFQEYLRVGTNLSDAEKAEAQKHIMDCQNQLAKRNGQPASGTPVPSAAVAPAFVQEQARSTTVGEPTPPSILVQKNRTPVADSGSRIRTAGIVTAGVGGAALLAGVVLNLKANSIASSYQDSGGYTQNKESDRKTYETFAWVGYGLGAACVATGAVIYLYGRKGSESDSSSVALLPAFAPGEAGAVLKGAF